MTQPSQHCPVRIQIGCQGWRYEDWRKSPSLIVPAAHELALVEASIGSLWQGPFYSSDLSPEAELSAYAQTFSLVEVDATFYAVPPREIVIRWRDATPDQFRFTLKLPRQLTHDYRLRKGRAILAKFCERAAELGPKLAAVLIQLPPSFSPTEWVYLTRFLRYLPAEIRFFIEFRDSAWLSAQYLEPLKAEFAVAPVLSETPWVDQEVAYPWVYDWPLGPVYVRVMGPKQGGLTQFTHLQISQTQKLESLVQKISNLASLGRELYVLVDNHFQGFSPGTASLLKALLQLECQPYPVSRASAQLSLPLG